MPRKPLQGLQGGHDVVVAWQLPKLLVRVRFPLPAPVRPWLIPAKI